MKTELTKAKEVTQILQVQLGHKEASFVDLYSLAIARMPKTDKVFLQRLQEILKTKQKHDMEAINASFPTQVNALLKEKEQLET